MACGPAAKRRRHGSSSVKFRPGPVEPSGQELLLAAQKGDAPARVRKGRIGVKVAVDGVEPMTIERSAGKARRVLDQR